MIDSNTEVPSSPAPPPAWRSKAPTVLTPQSPETNVHTACTPVELPHENAVVDNPHELTTASTPQAPSSYQSVFVLSDMPLSEWRGSATTFNGFKKTRPDFELKDGNWNDICNLLCPARPDILHNKSEGRYVVPCLLKEAPLVGSTLDIAKYSRKPLIGKMRSKSHVTAASILMIDIDGLPHDDFIACLEKLKTAEITHQAFSTHSHGNPNKPGVRARMVIPVDRPLSAEDYEIAWFGFDHKYFSGLAGRADPSGAKLYQQQGVFCCHPSRINLAKSWSHNAGVASADALIQFCRIAQPSAIPLPSNTARDYEDTTSTIFPISIIIALLDWIDPDSPYPKWLRVLMAVFNVTHGSMEGLELADAWSSKGNKYKKGDGEVEKKWKTFQLGRLDAIKIGTLIMYAREAGADATAIMQQDEAFEVCESEEESSDESDLAASPDKSPPHALEPLAAIQQKFGLLNISGKLCILVIDVREERTDQDTSRKLLLSNRSDGSLLIERALRAEYNVGDEAPNIVKEFLVHPNTFCYMGIEFNPKGTSANYLNLWEGPTVIHQEGLWLLIQEFLYDVICDKNWDSYLYLLSYIAHALQQPEEKPGVMIVLIGGQGIGKGTLGRILQKIWSATYIQVNNIDAVVGTFNAILERAYIVFMDEALFAGNRRGTDELKSIVTEPIIQISEKYQPSRQIRSVHRFIAATNADHFKNTERDDRRDFTLRVSDVRKGDLDYWKVLNDEIEYGGVEAMVHDLLAVDLSGFNVRNKPNTKELVEQKIHSLDPIQRWWHDGLFDGDIANGDKSRSDMWPNFISTQEAIEGISAVNGGRMHKKPSAIIISQALQRLCPGTKQHQQQSKYSRQRGYLLPSLQQARAEFEKYIGGVVEWPEVEQSEVSHGTLGDDSESRVPDL